jgi:hypothetical protein
LPTPEPRRFPVPSTFEDHNNACFIVKDSNGVNVAYVYYEEERGRRTAANLMTKEEAHRIAANFAKLPGLLERGNHLGQSDLAVFHRD